MKRIPKGFQMGPHWVTVTLVSEAEMRAVCKEAEFPLRPTERPPTGLTIYDAQKIYVQKVSKGFSKQSQLQTFWHEYFHMLFWIAGRPRLARDETLVDVCGGLQLQMLQTASSTALPPPPSRGTAAD